MKKVFFVSVLATMIVFITCFAVYADSIVRVKCEDEDVGAEVYLNGKLVGNCPVDAPVKDGTLHLRARKIVNGDYEKLFEKELRIVDGVIQRIDVIMSAPQLTVEGKRKNAEVKRREEAAEARNQLRAAEGGDIDSMWKLAEFYDAGTGVEKSPSKANAWREKAKVSVAQSWIRAAEGGRIDAMKKAAEFYDAGYGVEKSPAKAKAWRQRAEAAQNQKDAIEKARIKQQKLDQVSYFENTQKVFTRETNKATGGLVSILWPITTVPSLVLDLISAPFKTTEIRAIQNEAALRPSTWGKPDSMIARASRQLKTNNSTNDNSLIVANK